MYPIRKRRRSFPVPMSPENTAKGSVTVPLGTYCDPETREFRMVILSRAPSAINEKSLPVVRLADSKSAQ